MSVFDDIGDIFAGGASAVGSALGGATSGLFSVFEKAIKTAGKQILQPVISFIGGLLSVYLASSFDILKVIIFWIISLLSTIFGEILDSLGFGDLDPEGLWDAVNDHEWGGDLIYAMNDIGIVDGLEILLVALIIRFFIMIIPMIG